MRVEKTHHKDLETVFILSLFIYFETERDSVQAGEGREGERIPSRVFIDSLMPGLNSQTMRS